MISEQGYDAEVEVLREIKGLGGTTLTVVNRANDHVRESSDLLVELGFDLPEVARVAAYIFAGQLTGLYTGLKKGLDPDNPRNLTRVVVLEEAAERRMGSKRECLRSRPFRCRFRKLSLSPSPFASAVPGVPCKRCSKMYLSLMQ